MTITAKTTKAEIRDYIEASSTKKAVKANKSLADIIKKALDLDLKKTKREDLVKIANAITKVLATPVKAEEVKAENSTKKLSKGVSKKQEITEESTEEKADTKKSKKSKAKKSTKKSEENAIQMAVNFPETLEVDGKVFNRADDIKNMDDLYEAISKDEDIMFAYYWTPRHLKQFTYFGGWVGQPKSFDNDLDLATAIYISDEKRVSYQISNYTEAIYTIIPSDLEITEDGMRYAGGIEFQIYRGE